MFECTVGIYKSVFKKKVFTFFLNRDLLVNLHLIVKILWVL